MYNFPLSIDLIYFLWLNDIKIPYMFSNLMSAHEKIFKKYGNKSFGLQQMLSFFGTHIPDLHVGFQSLCL